MEKAKINIFKCDYLSDFQTLWASALLYQKQGKLEKFTFWVSLILTQSFVDLCKLGRPDHKVNLLAEVTKPQPQKYYCNRVFVLEFLSLVDTPPVGIFQESFRGASHRPCSPFIFISIRTFQTSLWQIYFPYFHDCKPWLKSWLATAHYNRVRTTIECDLQLW